MAATDTVCIVENGEPRAAIVLAADVPETLRTACAEMQHAIQESTGALLAIVPAAPAGLAAIHVGPSDYVSALSLDLHDLDGDGFVIAFPEPLNIVIVGPAPAGTEFGVYEFLERYVGVRWLLPGPDGTDLPVRASIRIAMEPLRDQPAFFSRLFSGLPNAVQNTWARRLRMNGRVSFHHNLVQLFPPETYMKTHPEFFPIHDGKRFLPPTNDTHGWQPCFTAPGIVEEAVKNIVRYFDEHPEAQSSSLGVNDSSGHCECETCRARDPGVKNFLGRDHLSDRYFEWANAVVEGVLKHHPDKFFGCLAYSEIAQPPDRVKVHERIIPFMTYDRMKWTHPALRAQGEEMTQAWQAASPTVGWYDYIYGSPYCLPRVWFHHMADYYRFAREHGVRALYAEAYPNWGEGPKLYASLKLQWNPYLDVDALLDEWYDRCVGPDAAGDLKAYYVHWEEFWTRRILASAWFAEAGQYLPFYNASYLADVTPDEIAECRRLLGSVVAKTKTDKQRARAELLLQAFEYYEASALAYPRREPLSDPVASERAALAVVDDAAGRIAMDEKRRRLSLEQFPDDPVLVQPLTMERYPALRGGDWGATGLWKVYDWVGRSEEVRARLRQIVDSTENEALRDHARTMLAVAEGTGRNLLANPSFEQGGEQPEQWSLWVKWGIGSMTGTQELAHSGGASVLCDGVKRGGPYQLAPFDPGRYAAVCLVYTPAGQDSAGTVELSITPRDAEHRNLPAASTTITPVSGRWQAVATAARIPAELDGKRVAELLAIVIVNGFERDEKVYVDDVALFRLGDL
ncbi:MAG: DUF4838 domain-containing protein [Armatimonadota bacterium]|nr:MAG: DUF4838 domain-containing protein [Armatimonadota bacterium]